MANEGIHILVLHHTARPDCCLRRVLRALVGATREQKVRVEVVIQGPVGSVSRLFDGEPSYELVRIDNHVNLGMGRPIVASTERFLNSDYRWFMRLDDDIELSHGSIDEAIATFSRENKPKQKLDRVMIANQRSVPFMLKTKARPNKCPALYIEKGHSRRVNMKGSNRPKFFICDYVDTGCTIIDRKAIENGCVPDMRYFVGGFSIDFGWNAKKLGYRSMLYTADKANHFSRECRTEEHERVRRGTKLVRENGRRFMRKWGVEPLTLTQYTRRKPR